MIASSPHAPALWRRRFAGVVVWSTWLFSTALALRVAIRRGTALPWADDWDMIIPAMLQPKLLASRWLWSQHNEHRIPLLRLVGYIATRISRGDFRALELVNALLLSGTAAFTMVRLRQWRGRTILVDAAIPLLFLQVENSALYWGPEFQFVSATALAVGAVLGPSPVCVLLLPLCGGNGVVLGAVLAGWLGITGYRARRFGYVIAAMACLALIGLYLFGWQAPEHGWSAPTLYRIVTTTSGYVASFLQLPFGALWSLRAVVVLVWVVAVCVVLARAYGSLPAERSRIIALAALLTAELLLALVVGRGRAGRGWDESLEPHYASAAIGLGVALIATTAFIVPLVVSRRSTAVMQVVLLTTWVASYGYRLPQASYESNRATANVVLSEMRAGVPGAEIAKRHTLTLTFVDDVRLRTSIGHQLDELRARGLSIGPR